ncbi:54S ribosomal protein L6 [Pseudovirgaria hyperparasitica]|uniref:54S ribosomal protein L6 n=1 Tax=Pseudovirgaria hyperparasitica TaxID=470096 RepID=A0A6A6WE61_9PEZI|nr:54S ribosomal protein L6 [Pseudovirgaria hyperparasitica]KAF2760280.1 54S ribosomal protein L6 [Pseudovirgaria hyperparasitica]
MLSRTAQRSISSSLSSHPGAIYIPSFLLPAFQAQFSTTTKSQSRIGSAPISVPPEVQITIKPPPPAPTNQNARVKAVNGLIHLKGPLGEAQMEYPSFINVMKDPARSEINVSIEDRTVRKHREMWGTTRSYIHSHVLGISEGHTCILRFVGVGYRASVDDKATTLKPEYDGQKFVSLKVGYSHPIELAVPRGVKASSPQPTRLLLEGPDKHVLTQFAANIRKWRVPEPYKGKGIFVNNEVVRMKNKKIK